VQYHVTSRYEIHRYEIHNSYLYFIFIMYFICRGILDATSYGVCEYVGASVCGRGRASVWGGPGGGGGGGGGVGGAYLEI
jgi:hypothetical protein